MSNVFFGPLEADPKYEASLRRRRGKRERDIVALGNSLLMVGSAIWYVKSTTCQEWLRPFFLLPEAETETETIDITFHRGIQALINCKEGTPFSIPDLLRWMRKLDGIFFPFAEQHAPSPLRIGEWISFRMNACDTDPSIPHTCISSMALPFDTDVEEWVFDNHWNARFTRVFSYGAATTMLRSAIEDHICAREDQKSLQTVVWWDPTAYLGILTIDLRSQQKKEKQQAEEISESTSSLSTKP